MTFFDLISLKAAATTYSSRSCESADKQTPPLASGLKKFLPRCLSITGATSASQDLLSRLWALNSHLWLDAGLIWLRAVLFSFFFKCNRTQSRHNWRSLNNKVQRRQRNRSSRELQFIVQQMGFSQAPRCWIFGTLFFRGYSQRHLGFSSLFRSLSV